MGIFSKPKTSTTHVKTPTEEAVNKAKIAHRLEKGRLTKEIANKQANITRLKSMAEAKAAEHEGINQVKNAKITALEKELKYHEGIAKDEEELRKRQHTMKIAEEGFKEDKEIHDARVKRLGERQKRLGEEENDEYKKGYSDGVADGLRRAHDITREDRKMLTMIAMSTNKSEAIAETGKLLKDGTDFSDEPKK